MHKFEALLRQLRVDPSNVKVKQEIQQWLREHTDGGQTQQLWEEHWQKVNSKLSVNDYYRLEKILNRIRHEAKIGNTTESSPNRPLRINYRAIAASIVIPLLLLSGIYFFNEKRQTPTRLVVVLKTQTESRHFLLPDSTEVWLNSGSQLSYPENMDESNKRMVSLSGQAYFNVYHDKQHPFIVQTKQMDIRVLGTSFDVSAYDNDPVVSSTLEEGSIAVLNKAGKQLDKLVPGEQYALQVEHMLASKTRVQTIDFTSWRNGKLVFKEAGINEVARKLERRYACSITISEELQRENPTFNFSVTNERLEELCDLIDLAANAQYKHTSSGIYFTKK